MLDFRCYRSDFIEYRIQVLLSCYVGPDTRQKIMKRRIPGKNIYMKRRIPGLNIHMKRRFPGLNIYVKRIPGLNMYSIWKEGFYRTEHMYEKKDSRDSRTEHWIHNAPLRPYTLQQSARRLLFLWTILYWITSATERSLSKVMWRSDVLCENVRKQESATRIAKWKVFKGIANRETMN